MSRPKALSAAAIAERIPSLDGWDHRGGKLCKTFTFPDFVAAFGFMAQVALKAESMNHHPEWSNVYNRVEVALSTHDAGGITDLDFALAAAADAIAAVRS